MTAHRSKGALISVGYERRNLEEFVDLLVDNDVDVLVDVRMNAISRKRGFSKTRLAEALKAAGIVYRHERDLGNPKDNRDPFRQGLQSARDKYHRHLSNGAGPIYEEIVGLTKSLRVAVFCFERDHAECHRSCITDRATRTHPALALIKL